jgi:hypothetical protein
MILDLHDSEVQAPKIARQLNGQSLRTVTGGSFGDQVICTWISRYRRVRTVKSPCPEDTLRDDEQRAADPAGKLEMNATTVVRWIRQRRLEGRRQVGGWRAWNVHVTDAKIRQLIAFWEEKLSKPADGGAHRFYYRRKRLSVSGGVV